MALVASCKDNSPSVAPVAGKTALAPPPADIDLQIQSFENAVRQNPNNFDALILLGNILMDNGRYGDAIDSYQKALEISPENVNVRVDMGTCYRRAGQSGKAVEQYRKALTYQPDHPNALANMGVVLLYDMKDGKGALQFWEKYLEVAPATQMAEHIRKQTAQLKLQKKQESDAN